MPGTETPSSGQQLLRVLRHEHPLFALKLAKNTASWATRKYIFRNLFMTKTIHGHRMTFDLSDPGISRSLLLVGDREREHQFMLTEALKPHSTVLDIGANIGYYVLIELAQLQGTGRVIAIEPSPKNFRLLQQNIEQNDVESQTELINAAIADQDGTAKLHLSRLSNIHSLLPASIYAAKGRHINVKAISLATLQRTNPDISFIRMDVEGYEVNILRSLLKLNQTQKFTPDVLFELHPATYSKTNFDAVLRDLYQLGYQTTYLATSHFALLAKHNLSVIASLPTDGTVRHIAANVPLSALLKLYPRSRALLLQAA